MECINFDKQFERYMSAWIQKNGAKYKNNMDVMEGMMPDVYMEFLQKPADWLGGRTPEAYFDQFDDAGMLVEWMCEYERKRVPVPDLLLDRIGALGGAAQPYLMALLTAADVPQAVVMTAISLLRELESEAPMALYIEWIARIEGTDEKADMCAESLLSMGEAAIEPILSALGSATEAGRDVFADILSNYPGDDRIFELLMERFRRCDDRRALFASYLAKFGDARALPALEAAAQDSQVNYLDFVEISSAIEALGGDRPSEREFSGDPYYESLKHV